MSVSTTPPGQPPKKSGMGCLGCGCLVLALLVILFLGLVAGGCYLGYQKIVSLSSTTPAEVPAFNGGDDVYAAAQQKVTAFQHDAQNHQAATIQLSADEINALLARDPGMTRNKAHLFVTLTNDQARLQGSIPTGGISQGFLKDRYFNFDTTFGLGFNPDAKTLDITLHHLQIGDQPTAQKVLPTMQAELTAILNAELQQYPATKNLLQQAKSIQIKDGELVIETK
jgi:hypothetical protein